MIISHTISVCFKTGLELAKCRELWALSVDQSSKPLKITERGEKYVITFFQSICFYFFLVSKRNAVLIGKGRDYKSQNEGCLMHQGIN